MLKPITLINCCCTSSLKVIACRLLRGLLSARWKCWVAEAHLIKMYDSTPQACEHNVQHVASDVAGEFWCRPVFDKRFSLAGFAQQSNRQLFTKNCCATIFSLWLKLTVAYPVSQFDCDALQVQGCDLAELTVLRSSASRLRSEENGKPFLLRKGLFC